MIPLLARRAATLVALASALLTLLVAVKWGAFVAGGSDSNCYLSSARMWVNGTMLKPVDPGFTPPWKNVTLSLAPTGFVPSPTIPGAVAPICAPGLGVMMAVSELVAGPLGPFGLVPISAALTVWCGFLVGRRLAGELAGATSAVLTALSPILLYQSVQPMSDVPAAAAWLAALALAARATDARSVLGGLAASVALLIRPNLALLVLPVALLVALGDPGRGARGALRRVVWFGAGLMPGIASVAALNQLLYGSTLSTGYGDPSQLFSRSHVRSNVVLYPWWFTQTHTPWSFIGLAAASILPTTRGRGCGASPRCLAAVCQAAVALTFALYVPYVVFSDWTYLRFLLVAVVLLIVLGSAVTVHLASRLRTPWRALAIGAVALAVGATAFREARARGVFEVKDTEARFVETATWARDHLPANSIFLTIWHSGSMPYHGNRPTIVWDALEPDELDTALEFLDRSGRHPYLLLEGWEVPAFHRRFSGASVAGQLDWPSRAQVGRDVIIYDPRDRARYYAGEAVAHERVWTAAERRRLRR